MLNSGLGAFVWDGADFTCSWEFPEGSKPWVNALVCVVEVGRGAVSVLLEQGTHLLAVGTAGLYCQRYLKSSGFLNAPI